MNRTLAKLKRRAFKLFKLILFAEMPMGLVSWRYLLPNNDYRLKLHRQFWWQSAWRLAGPLGVMLQVWLYCRWLFWSGWYRSFWVVKRLAPDVTQREGISFLSQLTTTLKLCLGYCIHPRDVYRFQLYRQPERVLDYVYDRETQSFHAWQSQSLGSNQRSLQVVQDKVALEKLLAVLAIPVVRTAHCVASDTKTPLLSLMADAERVFCKTRSGNQGLGAFAAWKTGTALAGRTFQGKDLLDTTAVEKAWQDLLQRDEALIQPLLTNHPALAPMAVGDEVITVRYISKVHSNGISALSATLEVPAEREVKSQRIRYIVLPIDSDSGILQSLPGHMLQSKETTVLYRQVQSHAPKGNSVPYWDDLIAFTGLAHQQFPDIATLAWDWVVTPEGPVLLEGNSGWGTATPQLLLGGFLANLTNDS